MNIIIALKTLDQHIGDNMLKLFILVIALVSCSQGVENRRHGINQDNWIIRATMEVKFSNFGEMTLDTQKEQTFTVVGTVAPAVRFVVSSANFKPPAALEDMASYGSLDITDIYDNHLRVCGTNGTTKCKKALLKFFTRGAGEGFWDVEDQYGAPILTNGSTVTLEPKFVTLGTQDIGPLQMVVKLKQFTSDKALAIPLSINFEDAPAGNYSTTLVAQYLLSD